MISGFITIHRQILEWQWYSSQVHRSLFMHCLIKANFKDNFKGKTLIKRGSFVTSCQILANELGYTKVTILRALRDLEGTNELSRKSNNKGTMISITNYDSYQSPETQDIPRSIPRSIPPKKRQVSTNNKETKKQRNNKYTYSENLIGIFDDDEIISWCKNTGNKKIQDALYLEYNHSFLKEEITNAYFWQLENKKRKAGSFLKLWCERSNKPNKLNPAILDDKLIELMGGV